MSKLSDIPKIICNDEKTIYLVEMHFEDRTTEIEFLDHFEKVLEGDFEFVTNGFIIDGGEDEKKAMH